MKFKTTIGRLSNNVYQDHIHIPSEVYKELTKDGNKRVLCTVDDHDYFHAGLLPRGDGDYFIMLNKARMKEFDIELGQEVTIQLEKDTSKYGMRMPPEFDEVLETDEEGQLLFENLTPGKKRNLIHLIAKTKNSDLRIIKALTILDHLKVNKGALHFKLLNEALKVKNRKY